MLFPYSRMQIAFSFAFSKWPRFANDGLTNGWASAALADHGQRKRADSIYMPLSDYDQRPGQAARDGLRRAGQLWAAADY